MEPKDQYALVRCICQLRKEEQGPKAGALLLMLPSLRTHAPRRIVFPPAHTPAPACRKPLNGRAPKLQRKVVSPKAFEAEQGKQLAPGSNPAVRYDHPGVAVGFESGRLLQAMAVYDWVLTAVYHEADTREAVERDFQVLLTLQAQGRPFELGLLKEAEWVLASDEYVLGRPVFRPELEHTFGEIIRYSDL